MFSALLNNVAAAAQAVQRVSGLPPQVQPLRDHAATFISSIVPILKALSGQVGTFAAQASNSAARLRPQLNAWKTGDNTAHNAILATLQDLDTRSQDLLAADAADYKTLSTFRDQVLGDQRTVAATINALNAKLAGLRSAADSQRNQLQDQNKRLGILRFIPFAWAVAEIASLIGSHKTLEQQISDLENQISQLNGEAMQVNHAQGYVQGFSNQLQILENSMQTLLNAISLIQGQTQQILQSVQGGQQGGPVLLEAYLLTLESQAKGLMTYLNT
jgi:chromosome segregation ATPase